MDGAGDIAGISIPFVCGVALAAAVQMPPGAAYAVAGVSLPLCFAIGTFCITGRRGAYAYALLYFCLGMFCRISCGICGAQSLPRPQGTFALCDLIDSAGFKGEDTAALLKALLTGNRSDLAPGVKSAFRGSGASHILALSGLHLGIIYAILRKALAWTGNSRAGMAARSVVIIAISGFYVLVTGASASIVRAFIFILLGEIAGLRRDRRKRPLATFCTAATVQLAFNPTLISSAAFQLSYLAMLGIMLLFPRLDGWYAAGGRFDPVKKIWTSMAMSISCQVFTAPVVWIRFQSFPKYFLLANLIALPLAEGLIISALVTLALTAAGIGHGLAAGASDFLAGALIRALEIISSM